MCSAKLPVAKTQPTGGLASFLESRRRRVMTVQTTNLAQKTADANKSLSSNEPTNAAATDDHISGPNYLWLCDQTTKRMAHHGAHALTVDEQYSSKTSKNGNFRLSAYAWTLSSDSGHDCVGRMVYIRGQKSEIVNTWIFPSRPDLYPVFAAEIIAVTPFTRVAFVDIQTPALANLQCQALLPVSLQIRQRFCDLPCDELPPEWAVSSSQGGYTYARQADQSWTRRIQSCYLAYLDAYLAVLTRRAPFDTNPGETAKNPLNQLTEYQRHHMEHSPGKKFLGNLFGIEWTDQFMTDFLFAKLPGA